MITRRVDDLGRVVIPKELRKEMNIQEDDQLELSVHNEILLIRKLKTKCLYCRKEIDVNHCSAYPDFCENCLEKLRRE